MAASNEELAGVRLVAGNLRKIVDAALVVGRERTEGGKKIDDHQVHTERLAYLATEVEAVEAMVEYAEKAAGRDSFAVETAAIFTAMVTSRARTQAFEQGPVFGVGQDLIDETLHSEATRDFVRAGLDDRRIEALGRQVIEAGTTPDAWLETEDDRMIREEVRKFARGEVAPLAQEIHMKDSLVPETIISKMAELGFFGLPIPIEYGGSGTSNVAMILTTEELSVASLASAGSLITRPEILSKALLAGGSEEQKKEWLPKLASGEIMAAISVTEPDTGSDVAAVKLRAEKGELDGVEGWFLNGAKAWCTFAGRANVIAMLTRTDPDLSKGAKGLSLFIVPKDVFEGHEFEMKQPHGGTISGTADRTPGYRGMHSYTLGIDNYFVPAANLVGGEGRGFALQMGGFAAGRLQTGGRATGVSQAAIEAAASYANERSQFGQTIGSFQLTQYKLGRMAVEVAAGRQLTYHAARVMDSGDTRSPIPAMAKLFTCDVAVRTTQEAQILHGGWGFAEEFPICRYVVDALVLPIFEGVKPILGIKVIGRSLLSA
ncbi:MAG: acyl-CoA dehydrogenase family protein [Deltaproteobacteria bacterium]